MSNPIWITGGEHGAAYTTSGGGLANTATGSPAPTTTAARTGTYGLEFTVTGTAATKYIRKTLPTPSKIAGVLYFKVVTTPSAAIQLMSFGVTAGSVPQIRLRTDLKLEIGVSPYTVGTQVLSTGTWYRLDFSVDASTGTTVTKCQIDGSNELTHNLTQTATTLTYAQIGINPTATGSIYYDDIYITDDSADYPIGEVLVVGLSPSSDGTHNAGTDVMEDNAGTDIGTTTAYDKVNSVPIGNETAYIQQANNGSGNYAEVNFADTTQSTIRGTQAILAYRAASATACNGSAYVIDEDSTETTIWGSAATPADYSENTVFYKSAVLPAPAGGWDQAAVNALKARIGHSTDANPDPYWIDLFLEVAYVAGSGTQNITANGFANANSFGTPTVTPGSVDIAPNGHANTNAFGTARLDQNIVANGFANTNAFGSSRLDLNLAPTGYGNLNQFGAPTITPGAVNISPSGHANTNAFGTATVSNASGPQTITANGYANTNAFGNPTVSPGAVNLTASGYANTSAFGNPTISQGGAPQTITANGHANTSAFGTPTVANASGPQTITAVGFANSNVFGSPTVSGGDLPPGTISLVVIHDAQDDTTVTHYATDELTVWRDETYIFTVEHHSQDDVISERIDTNSIEVTI